jgi:uncharacterized protein (TIGR02596 family)
MKTPSSRNRGFSLLELIVVILIISIIAAFAVPAASTILRGSHITQASQIVVDQITLARQQALTRNHPVEVRFIRYADPEVPSDKGPDGKDGAFRAIQVFDILDNGAAVPIDKPQLFPQSVVMNSDKQLSSLLGDVSGTGWPKEVNKAKVKQDKTAPKLPRKIEDDYEYIAFRFMPDGSTNLKPKDMWFITIHNMNDKAAGGTPPNNFFTLQIDPVSGATKAFRPGV